MRRISMLFTLTALVLTSSAGRAAIVAEIPIELLEGQIWIKLAVPQQAEPLNFLIDSGAQVSVISLSTARQLGLNAGLKINVQGVSSQTEGRWPLRMRAKAGSIDFPRQYAGVNLDELSRACVCRLDGLIGVDFFREHIVQIDYASKKLRILSAVPAGHEWVPMHTRRNSLCVDLRVNETLVRSVRIDTGCAMGLHWVTPIKPVADLPRRISVGLTQVSIPTLDTTVKIGRFEFRAVATGLHEEQIFSGEGGLLGNALLSEFVVTFDTKGRRLFLQPTLR